MARPCTVCTSERRREIDEALRKNVPYETIGARFNLAVMTLLAHRSHLDGAGGPGAEPAPPDHAPAAHRATVETLLDQMRGLCDKSFTLLQAAEASSEPRKISLALVQVRRNLKAFGDLTEHVRQSVRAASGPASGGAVRGPA